MPKHFRRGFPGVIAVEPIAGNVPMPFDEGAGIMPEPLHKMGDEPVDWIARERDDLQFPIGGNLVGTIPAHQHVEGGVLGQQFQFSRSQWNIRLRLEQLGQPTCLLLVPQTVTVKAVDAALEQCIVERRRGHLPHLKQQDVRLINCEPVRVEGRRDGGTPKMREDRSFNGPDARRPPSRTPQPKPDANEATQARAYRFPFSMSDHCTEFEARLTKPTPALAGA